MKGKINYSNMELMSIQMLLKLSDSFYYIKEDRKNSLLNLRNKTKLAFELLQLDYTDENEARVENTYRAYTLYRRYLQRIEKNYKIRELERRLAKY